MKIISLVPSITELLHALGLEQEVVGITKFCVHPQQWHRTKTRVGGTKNIHIPTLKALQPDLIIASKEENVKEQIAAAAQIAKVYVTDVSSYETALQMIRTLGTWVHKKQKAREIAVQINDAFATLPTITKTKRALYCIWQNPWMTVGGDTFIHSMMQKAGFVNVCARSKRYPVFHWEDVPGWNVEYLLLSSEPYPFKERHVKALQQQFPALQIIRVDGEMFSWYGSRMIAAATYLSSFHQQ